MTKQAGVIQNVEENTTHRVYFSSFSFPLEMSLLIPAHLFHWSRISV